MVKGYRVIIRVKEFKGFCPLYQIGDTITIEKFYVKSSVSKDVCMHALIAMSTLLSPLLHGSSAQELGIGPDKDLGYLQCPDPGPPCTKGGTVLFELRREVISINTAPFTNPDEPRASMQLSNPASRC